MPADVDRGEIALTLRLGVTGHRHLPDIDRLGERIRRELERLPDLLRFPSSPTTPLGYVVLSALADGADRLVVREAMARAGAQLEAVLPLPPEEYRRDFGADSAEDFDELLGMAARVRLLPPAHGRDEAYENAGRHIVDESDVLIALWDGAAARGRGGTAEIVAYARERHVPRIVISTVDDDETLEKVTPDEAESQKGAHLSRAAFERLDAYNRERIEGATFARGLDNVRAALAPPRQLEGPERLPLKALADWVLPQFVRADLLATRHQKADERYGVLLFSLAAAAVTVEALQSQFFPSKPGIVAFELLALVVIAALLAIRRPLRAHERWITYRYLAEQLRSAFFLVLAGVEPVGARTRTRAATGADDESSADEDPSEEWIRRALEEVASRRPPVESVPHRDVAIFLADRWIEHQASYYQRSAKSHRRRHRQLTEAIWTILILSILVATFHLLGVGEGEHGSESRVGEVLVFLSISAPACAAALGGIRELHDHRRHAERYGRTARVLTTMGERMRSAGDGETTAAVASETARVIREEASDWFGVVRFEELDAL